MYVLPLILALLICLAIFFSPILAIVLFVLAAIAIGGAKYFGGRGEVEQENPPATAGQADVPTPPQPGQREEHHGGIWGETWPEQR